MKALMKTSHGDITLELFPDKTPATVANFVQHVRDGFYDGLIFHRVISNFMVQGGGFTPDMQQKEAGEPIENEAKTGLPNEVGAVAMARTMAPHSATTQFFINVSNNSFLNADEAPDGWGYAAFAKVTDGMDVVNEIKTVKTGSKAGHQDVPVEPVVIESITIEES
ncbi:MAG: peptidyl-prolyl cis-trans isomerase [Natronospirillum sp.]|uniref:peptidylprolyl isomerase n=1 Tax=Natronospirillum sp. TaxID=2812955 RepID=UPI0025F3295D|nr:peptidylprolyl isomerase [Natronospirillum sp.]MCH8552787.1 peptidyl-prolyl cis-trans isomerase [Natronospirillum sp.]